MNKFTSEQPVVVHAVVLSAILSSVFVVLVTILAELFSGLKNWLAESHGHHWVGKGIWTMILFVIFSFASYFALKVNVKPVSASMVRVAGHVAMIGAMLILAYFVFAYLTH